MKIANCYQIYLKHLNNPEFVLKCINRVFFENKIPKPMMFTVKKKKRFFPFYRMNNHIATHKKEISIVSHWDYKKQFIEKYLKCFKNDIHLHHLIMKFILLFSSQNRLMFLKKLDLLRL